MRTVGRHTVAVACVLGLLVGGCASQPEPAAEARSTPSEAERTGLLTPTRPAAGDLATPAAGIGGTEEGADELEPQGVPGPGHAGVTPAGDASPPPDVELALDDSPIATLMTELVREWDRTNFEMVQEGAPDVIRVAAEIEQFATLQQSSEVGVFHAAITETALLGGTVDGQGRVREVVAIVTLPDRRDLAVALTTLRVAQVRSIGSDGVDGIIAVIAADAPGTQHRVMSPDGLLVIERFGEAEGSVFVAFASGVDPDAFADRARVLAAAVVTAASFG